MRQSVQDMVKNELSPVPPVECAFKTGDTVTFTNEYGVKFEGLKVIGFKKVFPTPVGVFPPVHGQAH